MVDPGNAERTALAIKRHKKKNNAEKAPLAIAKRIHPLLKRSSPKN